MRSLVVLAGLGLLAATAPAATASPGPGPSCQFIAFQNATMTGYVGEVDGGPIVIADGTDPRTGRLTCTIRVNGDTHNAEARAAVTSRTTTGVVLLRPTVFEFVGEPDDFVVMCTSVEIDGVGTFYKDMANDAWSTDPSVSCIRPLEA